MLDLFAGRLGWSKAFLARGWEVTAVDLVPPPEHPTGLKFNRMNVLDLNGQTWYMDFDFICASPPCEQFSVHGMKHFHPSPKYPELGVDLFNHTREICEASGVPYVIENVRSAQQFVGNAVSHCGPFYLWGTGVPAILPQGIGKGSMIWSPRYRNMKKSQRKKEVATIPPELASCVAEYAERLLEVKV